MSDGYIQGAWLGGLDGGEERTSDSSPPPPAALSSRLWSSSDVSEGLRLMLEISSAEEWILEAYIPP
jgi:hypothetical protein